MKLAAQKKEEEDRIRKEDALKKAKEAEEKRKRLEEAEKKRQAMMQAQKDKQSAGDKAGGEKKADGGVSWRSRRSCRLGVEIEVNYEKK